MAHTLYGVDGIRWFAALVRGVLVNGLFEQVLLNKGGIEQVSQLTSAYLVLNYGTWSLAL